MIRRYDIQTYDKSCPTYLNFLKGANFWNIPYNVDPNKAMFALYIMGEHEGTHIQSC